MPAGYFLYGLRILSNIPIPSLSDLSRNHQDNLIDVELRLKEKPRAVPHFSDSVEIFYSSPHRNAEGDPILRVGNLDNDRFIFFYSDDLRFSIARDGHEVVSDWPDDYSLEDAATYLLGPILGFVLRLRGLRGAG